MNYDKILKPGNEVRVKNERDNFITTINEFIGEDTLAILEPLDHAQTYVIAPGETYLISCVTESGLYMFEALVTDVRSTQKPAIIELKAISDYKKVQRREAYRARETIQVNVRSLAAGAESVAKWIVTSTVDISETGMLLRYSELCVVGQLLEFIIRIDTLGMNEVLSKTKGRVVRCSKIGTSQNKCLLGIAFETPSEKTRNAIIKLVVLSQRSKLTYKHVKRFR